MKIRYAKPGDLEMISEYDEHISKEENRFETVIQICK